MKVKIFETNSLSGAKIEARINEFLTQSIDVVQVTTCQDKVVILYKETL